ncbi:hypothetical protein BJX62DRAFT_245092 [Aspergillus germanicus]
MHLFNSETDSTPSGTKYQVLNHDIVAGNGLTETNIANVVAAINLMDNPKYEMDYNAYCYKSTVNPRSHNGWGSFVRARKCNVKFNNAAATTKLKRGEQPTTEEMFRVEHIDTFLIQYLRLPRKSYLQASFEKDRV